MTNRIGPLQIISGSDVRNTLGLDRAGYVDWNLLLGTDFSQRIKNVGPARALKFIREHKSIERIVETEVKYPPRVPMDIYLEQVSVARLVFETLPPVPEGVDLQQGTPNEARVQQVLRKYGVHDRDFEWEQPESIGDSYFGDNPSVRDEDFVFIPYR
jgi:flap endonuclease-1